MCLIAALLTSLLPGSVFAATTKDSVLYTFDSFAGSQNGATAPSGFSLRTSTAYVNDSTGYAGVWSKDLGGDNKAFELRANKSGGLGLGIHYTAGVYTGTIEASVSLYLNDYNIRRYFGVYDCNHYGNEFMQIRENNGEVYFFGSRTQTYISKNTWYDVKIIYNLTTNLAHCEIWKNGSKIKAMDVTKKLDRISSSIDSLYVYHGKEASYFKGSLSNPAISAWDNLAIKEVDDYVYPLSASYDFEAFSGDGITAPEGLTFTGAEAGKTTLTSYELNGNKVLKFASQGEKTASIVKSFPLKLNGRVATVADITADSSAASVTRFFGVNSGVSLLAFDSTTGKIMLGTSELASYSDGQTYSVVLELNSLTKKAKAKVTSNGVSYSGETDIAASLAPYSSLGFYVNSIADESVCYIDNLGIYSVAEFGASLASPINVDGLVTKDADLVVKYTNPLKTLPSVKLGTEDVDSSLISVSNKNELVLEIADSLDFDTAYTLTLSNAEDIFGNKINLEIPFRTIKEYEIGSISLTKSSNKANASVTIKANVPEPIEASLIAVHFTSSGEMADVDITSDSVALSSGTLTAEVSATSDGYTEAYLVDSISTLLPIVDKAVLGTAPACSVEPLTTEISFKSNQASGLITASKLGIGTKVCGFIVLKPGKTSADLNSNPESSICHIKLFGDEYTKDGYAFPIKGLDGDFDVLYKSGDEVDYISDAFRMYSVETINSVLALINTPVPSWNEVFSDGNSAVLSIDTTDYIALTPDLKQNVHTDILASRAALLNGEFAQLSEFVDIYNKALAPQTINAAQDGNRVKAMISKYNKYFKIEDADAYDTFSALSSGEKDSVYSAIASKNNYSDIDKVLDSFNQSTVLVAIKTLKNSVDVKKIITDNNSWLLFNMSNYNALNNQHIVNDQLAGKSYADINALKTAFETAAEDALKKEKSSSSSHSGSPQGSGLNISVSPTPSAPTQSVPVQSNSFKDMAGTQWAADAVESLYKKGIVNGRSDTVFAPNDNVTREEFAKLLVCAFHSNNSSAVAQFADIPADAWYTSYVATAAKLGIVSGKGGNLFGSGEHITRQDMAVMAARAASIEPLAGNSAFDDFNTIADYAKAYVSALTRINIINGKAQGVFAPLDTATRAEACVIIHRLLEMRGE